VLVETVAAVQGIALLAAAGVVGYTTVVAAESGVD
jgi:hypothetical protein